MGSDPLDDSPAVQVLCPVSAFSGVLGLSIETVRQEFVPLEDGMLKVSFFLVGATACCLFFFFP